MVYLGDNSKPPFIDYYSVWCDDQLDSTWICLPDAQRRTSQFERFGFRTLTIKRMSVSK